ncbi:hypothetical protein [uncultured Desulfovibrio sp.]|uniref:hypothetical protein n=1 Tax=uncultured Desulfovibrio sp. TaxID=167968 RepID=UPI0021FC74AB|nr:hypothetical protein [uncultured Desulfovibrio sp.]CAI3241563.1 hypothetical protein DWUX_2521 [Desulfovibrio diazotrophicus]
MGWEHEPETVWKAQELYCVDRLSFARVAELTGVSATTLKAWSEKYGWRAKRAEIAQAESDIRVTTITARKTTLEKLLLADDGREASQLAFAVASLENLALKQLELAAAGKIPAVAPERPAIATRADAIAALRTAVEHKLGLALADPAKITVATVQDVQRCLALVAELEATLPKDTENTRNKALSPENARAIREILGTS